MVTRHLLDGVQDGLYTIVETRDVGPGGDTGQEEERRAAHAAMFCAERRFRTAAPAADEARRCR